MAVKNAEGGDGRGVGKKRKKMGGTGKFSKKTRLAGKKGEKVIS